MEGLDCCSFCECLFELNFEGDHPEECARADGETQCCVACPGCAPRYLLECSRCGHGVCKRCAHHTRVCNLCENQNKKKKRRRRNDTQENKVITVRTDEYKENVAI